MISLTSSFLPQIKNPSTISQFIKSSSRSIQPNLELHRSISSQISLTGHLVSRPTKNSNYQHLTTNSKNITIIRTTRRYSSNLTSTSTDYSKTNRIQSPEGKIIGRSGKTYSPRTVKVIEFIGKLLGYNLKSSTAITLTSDYYDRCANRFEIEKEFWIEECGLPDSFQTWFQITQLHMWLLTVRFRSMKAPLGQLYNQELVNHAFLDTEHRIRGPQNKVSKATLIKKYMEIMLHQHRGLQLSLDWAITRQTESDQFLAAAIWRNIFGAAWGTGMGGVRGIHSTKEESSTGKTIEMLLESNNSSEITQELYTFQGDIEFSEILERLVIFIRKELIRLDSISDKMIFSGDSSQKNGITNFGKI